ncbi:VOC family metalloprotein YjdN [Planctobacterium marinum]|uniref:VOC family protein n=1 Tax=Planctobacterium marinum TaxID=1631968 RepID=A0AA48HS90_9ALTE|nr:VOC family protein [Planctobacterium marinum]
MHLVNYLIFNGRCEEAIEYYQKTLNAELVMLMRFEDMPAEGNEDCQMPEDMGQKIMHAEIQIGDSKIMMSDSPEQGPVNFSGFSLSIAADSIEQGSSLFSALAEDGKVIMPLAETFWAKAFGMLEDKFGLSWMVNVEASDES